MTMIHQLPKLYIKIVEMYLTFDLACLRPPAVPDGGLRGRSVGGGAGRHVGLPVQGAGAPAGGAAPPRPHPAGRAEEAHARGRGERPQAGGGEEAQGGRPHLQTGGQTWLGGFCVNVCV